MSTIYSIVHGVPTDRVRELIDESLRALPGDAPRESKWSDYRHEPSEQEVVGVVAGDNLILSDLAHLLAADIARRCGTPHMELRIQGDHWDFTLFHHGDIVADFSTRVGAFPAAKPLPRPWKQGGLDTFASTWRIDRDMVEPYLIDWDQLAEPIWCRPGDGYSTGNWEQILDFMRVIGVAAPHGHPDRFVFQVPCWQIKYRPQPRWRRFVRKLSVLARGVYPDVARHTPEEKELWRLRRQSIRVVKLDPADVFNKR